MASYNSVFKRVEKKYRISAGQRAAVEGATLESMAVDSFGRSRITSLYLDTPERAMIARSVEKPLYKEKLRLRAYGEAAGVALMVAFAAAPLVRERGGVPLSDAEVEARVRKGLEAAAGASDLCSVAVFFGIKKKYKGIVYKRRLALTLPAALAFVSGLSYEQACARWPLSDVVLAAEAQMPTTRQIARELAAAMDRNLPLVPSMGIACDREAWGYVLEALIGHDDDPLFDSELRITFDDHLAYFDCHRDRAAWQPIIEPVESIMEIKSAGPYPAWLVAVLSANTIYPASFTKYGNAYQMAHGRALSHQSARSARIDTFESGESPQGGRFSRCCAAV